MSFLILVKHSLPVIDPKVPAAYWELSDEGRQRCIPLAAALSVYNPGRVFTSCEPKAIETGQIVASRLNLPCTPVDDLHEHRRLNLPFTSRPEFKAGIARFFTEPEKQVLGEETAVQATTRFGRAVSALIDRFPQETLILVSHGTVISLFYQSIIDADPFPLWQKLGLPAYLVFSLPDLDLVKVVAQPAAGD